MVDLLTFLMEPCPVCRSAQAEPKEFCRRCGCHLLLLAKIRYASAILAFQEKHAAAKALY